MKNTLSIAALLILGGCNADHSIGQIDQDAGPDVPNSDVASLALDTGASPQVQSDAQTIGPLGPVQSWTGYVENYLFSSGSDVIRFTFAQDSSGRITGQVVFGIGTPPPPATDPNVGYLVGFRAIPGLIEGFSYSIVSGNLTSNRLRFGMVLLEPWAGWCSLQIPMDDSGSCLPNWGGFSSGDGTLCYISNPANGERVIVDCGKMSLCMENRICACSATRCVLDEPTPLPTIFDLVVSNGTANGSLAWSDGDHNVHFTKDP